MFNDDDDEGDGENDSKGGETKRNYGKGGVHLDVSNLKCFIMKN